MKLYDFDGMFDQKLFEYVQKNSGKYKEEEWEDIIPALYQKFGDTKIKSLGLTPREFYAGMTSEHLIRTLRAHIMEGVPVSEFLCDEIEKKCTVQELMPLLDGTEGERDYAINLIGPNPAAAQKYMQILLAAQDEDLQNRCVDNIKENADMVVEQAAECYRQGRLKECMLEIMSRATAGGDEIFNILLTEFRTDPENIPMHASYLAAYGDERALPYLLDKIDEEGISFIEYQELKFAIEALGGEYTKERDFSSDPYYQLIKGHSPADMPDLFDFIGKKPN